MYEVQTTQSLLFHILQCLLEHFWMYAAFSFADEPLAPENFTCISDNWESLTCTWDIPYNPVKTTYELFYYEQGNAGG